MSIRGALQGSLKQEGLLDQRSLEYERIEIEKNLEKGGAGREKGNGKNLVSDPTIGQETVITERTGTIEIVTEPETKRGTEIVAVIEIVIVHVIVIKVGTVVVIMIEIGITDVLVIGTEIGIVTTKLEKQILIVRIPAIGIMSMITWMQNMTAAGMVKENVVIIMLEQMRIKDGMMLIVGTSVLEVYLMIRVMTITGITETGDNMMIRMLWVMIVTIIMPVRVAIWKKITMVTIEKPKNVKTALELFPLNSEG